MDAIEIYMNAPYFGSCTPFVRHVVPVASQRGLAVTPAIHEHETISDLSRKWSVTHVASGLAVAQGLTRAGATIVFKELLALDIDWTESSEQMERIAAPLKTQVLLAIEIGRDDEE